MSTKNHNIKPLNRRKNGSSPEIGVLEWFRPGEYEQVECTLTDLETLGVKHLRTGISWADYHTPEGKEWYNWLFPRLGKEVELLPCFLYTPPSIAVLPKPCAPPREPKAYADFIDEMITLYGEHFEWVELWNEPNNVREWDWTLDGSWNIFSQMILGAAYWAKQRGKKTVLGGMAPIDTNWLEIMYQRGVMEHIDVVGIHGFPDTFDRCWMGWEHNIKCVRDTVAKHDDDAEVWVTEAGFSTWRHEEHKQLSQFVDLVGAPAERIYWYSMYDLHPDLPTVDGFHYDEREYHFGLKRSDGSSKLLYRLWAEGGLGKVAEMAAVKSCSIHRNGKSKPALITGGAGFIGTNLAARILDTGHPVLIYDSLSRPGVERNLRWLQDTYGELVEVQVADVRDQFALKEAVESVDQIFHFAAQVAVTTSLTGPMADFEVNASGTVNLLEAIRALDDPPPLIFTSTNKVYGDLGHVELTRNGTRYEPQKACMRNHGVCESCPLDFHSPYGCSKGAADQYVLDYSRSYGLKTAVFRMSCIYGPHQFGTEDQGWVAHFLISAIEGKPITLYGDGMQVRDILYVEDLVNAFLLARDNIDKFSGEAFNIGGGVANIVSLVELIELIAELEGQMPEVQFDDWRVGDQRYYVSDTRKFQSATGWTPETDIKQGVAKLHKWLLESRGFTADSDSNNRRGRRRSEWKPRLLQKEETLQR